MNRLFIFNLKLISLFLFSCSELNIENKKSFKNMSLNGDGLFFLNRFPDEFKKAIYKDVNYLSLGLKEGLQICHEDMELHLSRGHKFYLSVPKSSEIFQILHDRKKELFRVFIKKLEKFEFTSDLIGTRVYFYDEESQKRFSVISNQIRALIRDNAGRFNYAAGSVHGQNAPLFRDLKTGWVRPDFIEVLRFLPEFKELEGRSIFLPHTFEECIVYLKKNLSFFDDKVCSAIFFMEEEYKKIEGWLTPGFLIALQTLYEMLKNPLYQNNLDLSFILNLLSNVIKGYDENRKKEKPTDLSEGSSFRKKYANGMVVSATKKRKHPDESIEHIDYLVTKEDGTVISAKKRRRIDGEDIARHYFNYVAIRSDRAVISAKEKKLYSNGKEEYKDLTIKYPYKRKEHSDLVIYDNKNRSITYFNLTIDEDGKKEYFQKFVQYVDVIE